MIYLSMKRGQLKSLRSGNQMWELKGSLGDTLSYFLLPAMNSACQTEVTPTISIIH